MLERARVNFAGSLRILVPPLHTELGPVYVVFEGSPCRRLNNSIRLGLHGVNLNHAPNDVATPMARQWSRSHDDFIILESRYAD
jgi:hypothetical protein